MSDDDVNEFAKNLLSAKRELTYCSICGRLTDDDPVSYTHLDVYKRQGTDSFAFPDCESYMFGDSHLPHSRDVG